MRRFWAPRWIARHVLMVVLVTGFLALAWWQIDRAAAGNVLSYAYAVEWPVFAGFVVFIWLRWMRDEARAARAAGQDAVSGSRPEASGADVAAGAGGEPVTVGAPSGDPGVPVGAAATAEQRALAVQRRRRERSAAYDDADDELGAYNRYLAWLNANPQASARDYPG